MANISFQLNTTTGFSDSASAIANWGSGNVITAWVNDSDLSNNVASGDVVYQNNDGVPNLADGTLSNPFQGGLDYFAFEQPDGSIAAAQIDNTGSIPSSVFTTTTTSSSTTTTTAAPQTFTILVSDDNGNTQTSFNEGDLINVTIQASVVGGSINLDLAGSTAVEADFTTWPTLIGTGNTTATLDFSNATTVGLQFVVSNDLSDNANSGGSPEGSETIVLTLSDANSTSETITITDSSQNQPPTLTSINATITQTGDANNHVTIDFSGNTNDPENNPNNNLEWVISSIPSNGTFRDPNTPNTDLTVSDLPYTLSGFEVRYYPGTTFIGTENVINAWVVSDPNGGQSNTANITITVNPPQNQPPVADNVSESFSAGQAGVEQFFSRTATDPDGDAITFDWCDVNGVTKTENEINQILQHGQISPVSGETFKYTTSTVLGPNDSSVQEQLFYYKATEVNNPSSVSNFAQVQFQLLPPGNNPPTFDVTPGAAIEITAGTPYQVTGITATDPEGHTPIVIAIDSTGGTDTNATATFNGGVLTVTGTTAGTVTVTLKATDSFGLTEPNNNITYTFNVVEVAYRPVRKSVFTNSDSSACALERPIGDAYYYSTAPSGTTFLPNLAVGAFIYTDSGLSNVVIPPSPTSPWISLEENLGSTAQIRAVKLNATTGAIEEILNCTVTGGNAWPILVKYNATTEGYCKDVYDEVEVWQNISETATLADVVAANGQLFRDEYYANQYQQNNAPSEYIVEDGAYSDANMSTGQYYFWNNPAWSATGISGATDPNLFECPPPIVYDTRSLDVYFYSPDPADIGAVCNAQNGLSWQDAQANFNLVTIYYRKDVTDLSTWSLLDLAKAQTFIWATQADADTLNYQMLHPSAILLDVNSGGLVLWDNDNFTGFAGSYSWYAFSQDDNDNTTLDNLLEVADANSGYGFCGDGITNPLADYNRPAIWDIGIGNSITVGTTSGSRNNLYFAFFPCDVELDPGIPGGAPYYPLYIVDAMAESIEILDENTTSYLNKFAQTITRTGSAPNNDTRAQIKIGGKCLTFVNRIIATNIEEAVGFMQEELDNVEQYIGGNANLEVRPVSINAIDLGFGSQATLTYKSIDVSEQNSICYLCGTQGDSWDTYQFPTISDAEILNRTIPNFDLEENYVLDNVSKPLLRTNPKLSTNVKVVANSTDSIFLESIDATKELASVEYKKWELNPNGQYSQDLYKFFKNSSTPADIMYATRSDYSDFAVQDSFDKQIEEVYHYGTTYNYSKLHTEDFRMLAPIWLDKDIPKRFVVFRVNNPVGEMDFDSVTNLDNIQSLLRNSEIIKTFDLTANSSLGKYIRNHVNSESFPTAPVQFNFARGEKSSFKGIDLTKGGFTSKGEFLHKDFVRADSPIISSNAMITDGFKRNTLACANLLNLEFLFDDDNAGDYTINRYFGLYVNDIDSGYGNLTSSDNGNVVFKSLNSHINESADSAIPSFKQISGTPTLGYLSISDEFYKISSKATYDAKNLNVIVEDSANKIPSEIKTAPNGKSVDIIKEDSAGFDFVKFTVTGTPAVNDRFTVFESRESSYELKFLRHIPGEQWVLKFDDGGTPASESITTQGSLFATFESIKLLFQNSTSIFCETDLENKKIFITEKKATLGDLQVSFNPVNSVTSSSIVKVTQIQTSVNLDNSTFFATHNLEAGTFSGTSFSLQGSNSEIAKAMAGCINNSPISFDAIIADGASEFYVKNRVNGYRLLQSGVLVPHANANNFISLENLDSKSTGFPNGLLQLANVIQANNFVYYMNGGNSAGKSVLITKDSVADIVVGDMLPTNSSGVYNKVIDIVDDISNPSSIYKKLVLEKVNYLDSGEQKVYADNIAKIGLFSAYDIHDMNFDFYDIENSELKELEYEDPVTINYEPERSPSNTLTVFGEDYEIADPYSYFSGISDVLPEETLDPYNEVKLYSEYDRLQENNLKEFAVRSRVVPDINKWVLKDSLTVREQPYYLNSNEAFGRTNFSPDFNAVGRDRLGMTHEWFYMDNLPKYLQYNQLNDTFSYVNFLDGFELTPAHFKSTSYNYFDKFMVTDGFEVKDSYDVKSFIKTNLKKKYTLVSGGNDVSFANTIFKGIKVDFKNRKEFINDKATEFVKTSDFNGYKFSTLVLVRANKGKNDIEYEVIQNKKFKFVIFLITVSLDDLWIDGALNRRLLYEMNHSFVWNHEQENFSYSDVDISGALNLNDINFNNSFAADYRVAKGISHVDGSTPQFLDQINADEDNNFGFIEVRVSDSSGDVVFNLEIESVDDQDQITLASSPVDLNGNPVNVSNIAGYIQNSATYTYKQGGKNAFTSILDQLAVGSVSDLLRLNAGEVTYTTIDEDGQILNNQFEIEFENGVEIIKQSSLLTVSDEDKPKTFKLKQGTIGYNITTGDTYYPFLVRHNGYYTVDTRPVVTFTDTYSHFKTNTLQTTLGSSELSFEEPMYKHSLTSAEEIKLARDYYRRYNRCKTAFNLGFIQDDGSHDSVWGSIKNHFYRKVNESNASGVTKLSATSDKLPLYPLIGEVTIDKKDVNVFKSSWDKNYYTRALSGGLTEAVPGTFETKEERSYLGSTIMKVKDSYNLIAFTTQTVKTQEEQDAILANNNNTTDVVVFEDDKNVYVDFYITTTVKKLLSQDGVLESISKFVSAADSAGDKTTIKDDALLYVENNLLNTFNLDIIKIYTNRIKGQASEIQSSASINNLDDGGYMNDTNFTFKSHEQKPLNFRLIYNKRLGYSYRIRPMIKIKS